MNIKQIFAASIYVALYHQAIAQSSCSATNDNGGTCSVSCPIGQTAQCTPSTGSIQPECVCTGGGGGEEGDAILVRAMRSMQLQLLKNHITPLKPFDYFGAGPITPAYAQATAIDVNEAVNALLVSYGPVPVTKNLQRKEPYRYCHFFRVLGEEVCTTRYQTIDYSTTTQELITHGPIDISQASDIVFGAIALTDLPSDLTISLAKAQNCQNAGKATISQSVSVAVSRSASVSVTTTVSHSLSKTLGFNIKYDSVTINGSIQIQDGSTTATAKTETNGETITRSVNASVTDLNPMSAVAIQVAAHKIAAAIPFVATIIIDADLSPNDKNLKKLSDIASVDRRTFNVRGVLNTNTASQANVVYLDAPFNSDECKAGGANIVFTKEYKPPFGLKLKETSD